MNTDTGGIDSESSDALSIGWSLVEPVPFFQPSAKASPLACPVHDDRPRISAPFQVSSLRLPGPVLSRGPSAQIPRLSDLHSSSALQGPIHHPIQSAPIYSSHPLPIPDRRVQPPLSLQRVESEGISKLVQLVAWTSYPDPPPGNRKLKGPPSQPANQVVRARCPSASPALRNMWCQLLERLGPVSLLWTETLGSVHQMVHLNRVIDGFAPSTILKYVSTCTSFLKTCHHVIIQIKQWRWRFQRFYH